MPTRTKADMEFTEGENDTALALSKLADEHGISPVLSGCAQFLYMQTRSREKDAWDRHAEHEDGSIDTENDSDL